MKVQEIHLGGVAQSVAGRDKGRTYLIVGQEGETLLLADGKYRKLCNPKRKNRRHVRLRPEFYPDIAERIGQGKDENSRIRAALLSAEKGAACSGENPLAVTGETKNRRKESCPKTM